MGTLSILAIVMGSILTYSAVGGAVYEYLEPRTSFSAEPMDVVGAIFWPLIVPYLVLRLPCRAGRRATRWLGERRKQAGDLPEARVVSR